MTNKKLKTRARQRQAAEEQARYDWRVAQAAFACKCSLIWSDQHRTESTLAAALGTEEHYQEYKQLKENGEPYPLEVVVTPEHVSEWEDYLNSSGLFEVKDSERMNEQQRSDFAKSHSQTFTQALQKYYTT